ncbi:MAG: hypothetical protein PUD50_07485, partial [Eubacteriales bacterium]|nr:hypothetical protein [Eubacteriales bacterium]
QKEKLRAAWELRCLQGLSCKIQAQASGRLRKKEEGAVFSFQKRKSTVSAGISGKEHVSIRKHRKDRKYHNHR